MPRVPHGQPVPIPVHTHTHTHCGLPAVWVGGSGGVQPQPLEYKHEREH